MVAPRARACSSSSRTTAPEPSDNTKPSRPASHGRLAACGSSLRVDSARDAAKPPSPRPQVAISERSEEHTSELQSRPHLVCRLLLEKKKKKQRKTQQLNYNRHEHSS